MTEVTSIDQTRRSPDVYEDLDTALGDIHAVVGVMTACDSDECNIQNAAFAIERMVENAKKLADELYHTS